MYTSHSHSNPSVLLVCHLCRLVHDEGNPASGWMSKQAYREATGMDPSNCDLMHTYCPTCYAYLMSQAA
jgi:hypothetical protein